MELDPFDAQLFEILNDMEERIGHPLPPPLRAEVAAEYDHFRRESRRLKRLIRTDCLIVGWCLWWFVFDITQIHDPLIRNLVGMAQGVMLLIFGVLIGIYRERLRSLPRGVQINIGYIGGDDE